MNLEIDNEYVDELLEYHDRENVLDIYHIWGVMHSLNKLPK